MTGLTRRQRLALAFAVAVVSALWRTPCNAHLGPRGRILISTRQP